MEQKKALQKKLILAAVSVLLAFSVTVAATFAWYIYNTSAHTTKMHMAAGAGGGSGGLQINDTYADGPNSDHKYGLSAGMAETGILNPVSTDNVLNGFQKVYGFTDGSDTQSLLANLFGSVQSADFYKTTLYFRCTSGDAQDLYLGYVNYKDGKPEDKNKPENPISTAIRIGFVVYPAGDNSGAITGACRQYIVAINPDEHVKEPHYNTITGSAEGDYALESAKFKTDASNVPAVKLKSYSGSDGAGILCTPDNYYYSEKSSGADSSNRGVNKTPLQLGANGAVKGDLTPTRVDVYVWLEGCDPDCTNTIAGGNLSNVELEFVGVPTA